MFINHVADICGDELANLVVSNVDGTSAFPPTNYFPEL